MQAFKTDVMGGVGGVLPNRPPIFTLRLGETYEYAIALEQLLHEPHFVL